MKILHITNWHPNQENPYEAIWMRRHVEALANHAEQEVWHLEVRGGEKLKFHKYTDEMGCHHRILNIPMNRWFIIELLTAFLLWWNLRFKIKWKEFDILNIHIAYPLLTYWGWCKKMVKMPVVITEHWSAYHFNFGMPKDTNKLNKIKNIFNHNIPIITVSDALGNDIKQFAKKPDLIHHTIPNIVQIEIFHYKKFIKSIDPIFFMVSNWTYPKNPMLLIKAFSIVLKHYPNSKLNIGGGGNLIEDLQLLTQEINITENVCFLGPLSSIQIAEEQNKASAFLHASEYETFSVVCAEALCCGTPVIASKVGGILEYIDNDNGILIKGMNTDEWANAIINFLDKSHLYNNDSISKKAIQLFEKSNVGEKYYHLLKYYVDDFKK